MEKKKKNQQEGFDEKVKKKKEAKDFEEELPNEEDLEAEEELSELQKILNAAAENWQKKFEKFASIADEKYSALEREYANFRKRNSSVADESKDAGKLAVLNELLPVLDNLQRGRDCISDDAALQGYILIEKQLMGVLEKFGVSEIDALGKDFDMNTMNAVAREEDAKNAGKVTAVFLKGYLVNDKVLRHAVVRVAV